MPQELNVLRCFSCETFQVHIVKKAKKWECKICNEKQSIKKVFAQGSGKDCRLHVQKLNALRGQRDSDVRDTFATSPDVEESVDTCRVPRSADVGKWDLLLDERDSTDDSEEDLTSVGRGLPAARGRRGGHKAGVGNRGALRCEEGGGTLGDDLGQNNLAKPPLRNDYGQRSFGELNSRNNFAQSVQESTLRNDYGQRSLGELNSRNNFGQSMQEPTLRNEYGQRNVTEQISINNFGQDMPKPTLRKDFGLSSVAEPTLRNNFNQRQTPNTPCQWNVPPSIRRPSPLSKQTIQVPRDHPTNSAQQCPNGIATGNKRGPEDVGDGSKIQKSKWAEFLEDSEHSEESEEDNLSHGVELCEYPAECNLSQTATENLASSTNYVQPIAALQPSSLFTVDLYNDDDLDEILKI